MSKRALITGIHGQDGSYLAKFLLSKGYQVFGGTRRSSQDDYYRLRSLGINQQVNIINLDLTDSYNVFDTVISGEFDEIYNLGAQSFVGASWDLPIQTTNVNALGALYLLDAIRRSGYKTKFYQASTSEMYGLIQQPVQTEKTPFYPRSPYGVAKLFAHSMTVNYRESHGIFACAGILFNHESPLRSAEFVTKKITSQLAEIKLGLREKMYLGNLNARRDWGYAADYVEGMWRMLQANSADDYVLCTGTNYSVREFCELTGNAAGMKIEWHGDGINEIGLDTVTGREIISVSDKFYRPAEVDILLGNSEKAYSKLGWKASTTVAELAKMMFEYDLNEKSKSF